MEDQVPFKVFTYWTDDSKAEVRRFGVEKTVVTSFHYLNAKLQDVYPGLQGKNYLITWKDEDGDDITISSDEEVMTALTALHGNLIKLNVHVTSGVSDEKDDVCDIFIAPVVEATNAEGPADMTHYSVTCDGCNSQVVGFRYKCTSCYDFDLCSKCEAAGQHPEHVMVRLPSPLLPRSLVKAAIKRSRHFLKTVTSVPTPDAHKRHRRDKSAERREHSRGERHGDRHGDRHHRGEFHCRRPRTSWLETFTSYMNEFANLAGDVDLPTQEHKKKPEEQAKTTAENAQAPPQPDSAQPTPEANDKPKPNVECPFMPIEMYLNGILASFLQNANKGFQAPPANKDASTSASDMPAASSTPGPVASEDVEMDDGTQKTPEVLNTTVKTEPLASTSNENVRDLSPEKANGWTVIDKEKDLLDTSSASGQAAAPIGFNLPAEFQERVRINEGQNLYPPLNIATAVMNPKEPERPRVPQAPAAPQPPTAPQAPAAPQPPVAPQAPTAPQQRPRPTQSQSRNRHPLAHIDAAIEQMLVMGFTNDGGWLTKLLESKDGNIAAVLDLLTPAK